MNSPAEIICAALAMQGVCSLPGNLTGPLTGLWPVYVGQLPDSPDNAAAVYDLAGVADGRLMRDGTHVIHPGWQVRVRATDYPTAYNKASAIKTALEGFRNFQVAIVGVSYTIAAITLQGGILSMGMEPDARKRNNFALNGSITL